MGGGNAAGNELIEPVRARAASGVDNEPDNSACGLGKLGTSTESLQK